VTDDLEHLRTEIGAVDRQLLAGLNRRLELVARVKAHKDAVGERWIDAEREAELLRDLASANPGPLSERAVSSIFTAVLDVLKQELAADRPARPGPRSGPPSAGFERLAVVGTGLVGASVALAARRGGVHCSGFDTDAGTLADAAGISGLTPAASLAEAVAGADLVVVAVPAGVAVTSVREALDVAGPDATVTDVASTKRALAALEDARFVPGHPVAGGVTGGPRRAAADLFDGATWFLTPTAATAAERVAGVERFVTALGARPVRLEATAHDRLLALTSHLPHALANLLMLRVAAAAAAGDEAPLAHAGTSLREMTRVAGANPGIWADIFLENADEIAEALAGFRTALDELEETLRRADRAAVEGSIAAAATARERMDAFAYRTEAAQLNRIRVRVPDRPGILARITQILGAARINIEDFELRHVSPEYGGVLVILVAGAENAERARALLRREGYSAA